MIEYDSDFMVIDEAFPHIGKKIRLFWGYPEFVAMMFDLQKNDSSRPRAGFPGKVLFALVSLEEKHDIEFPHLKRQIDSSWHTL